MATSQAKICAKTLRGKNPLVRVNGLTCPETQGFLTSDPGHFISRTASPLCASAHSTGETVTWCTPKPGAGSALLSAPLGRQPAAVLGVLSALAGARGGSGFLPGKPSDARVAWHRGLQECRQRGSRTFGAGCQKTARGMGQGRADTCKGWARCMSLYGIGRWQWGKARRLAGLGWVVGWVAQGQSEGIGTCFILRCDQRQARDHCSWRCPLSLYTLVPTAISGGTQTSQLWAPQV